MRTTLVALALVIGLAILPVPPRSSASAVRSAAIDWQVPVTATKVATATAIAGVAPDANIQHDAYDADEPPPSPTPFMRAYFPHTEESPEPWPTNTNYSQDIRPATEVLSWYFEVQSSAAGTVDLTWDVTAVPVDRPVRLKDAAGTVLVADMRTFTQPFQFTAAAWVSKGFILSASQSEPPTVTVTFPNGGEIIKGTLPVTADATAYDAAVTQVAFEYSANNGGAWTAIAADTLAPYEVSWGTTSLADGNLYMIRATATDDKNLTASDTSNATFTVDNTAPPVPTLASPDNGTSTSDNTPTLDWSDVADITGVTYNVQVDNDSDFSSPEADLSGLASSTWTAGVLADGAYYWRVRATDGAGNNSAWSPSWSFAVDANPPPAPALVTPANGAVTLPRPAFDWTDVADVSGVIYDLQVDNNSNFSSPEINQTGLAASDFTLTVDLADGMYNWRIRAVEATGFQRTGSWSAVRTFTVNTSPTVTVTYPNGGETVNGTVNITASATDPDGVVTSVAFDYSSNGGTTWNPIAIDSDGADGWSVSWNTAGVADGSSYKIRATATDNDSKTGSDSSDAVFTVDNIVWEIQLRAAGGGLADNDNRAGVARAASAQYDVFDVPKPPSPGDFVRLFFPHSDWPVNPDEYSKDMRPAADEIIWDIEVITSFSGIVTLTWDASQAPAGYRMVVLQDTASATDTTDDQMVDLRTSTNYAYSAQASVPRKFRLIVSAKTFLATTFASGWNLFSFPIGLSPLDFSYQLDDDVSPLYLYWFNPAGGAYQMWSAANPVFSAEQGQGYWVKLTSPKVVDIEGWPVPDSDFTIHLLPGWNMIGNPFNYSVGWAGTRVSYGGDTVSIIDSHTNNWVLKYLYSYNSSQGSYVYDTAPNGKFDPWRGYWVKSLVEADLIIPAVPLTP